MSLRSPTPGLQETLFLVLFPLEHYSPAPKTSKTFGAWASMPCLSVSRQPLSLYSPQHLDSKGIHSPIFSTHANSPCRCRVISKKLPGGKVGIVSLPPLTPPRRPCPTRGSSSGPTALFPTCQRGKRTMIFMPRHRAQFSPRKPKPKWRLAQM